MTPYPNMDVAATEAAVTGYAVLFSFYHMGKTGVGLIWWEEGGKRFTRGLMWDECPCLSEENRGTDFVCPRCHNECQFVRDPLPPAPRKPPCPACGHKKSKAAEVCAMCSRTIDQYLGEQNEHS